MADSFALRLRQRLLPDALDQGWMPIALLGYLLFLFVPMLGRLFPDVETFTVPFHLGATLASIAVFLPLYFHVFRRGARWKLPAVLAVFTLGCVLLPWNAYANTYVIYAASLLAVLSMIDSAVCNALRACSWLPSRTARSTCFTYVRIRECRLSLCSRRF